jgi:hypothetical protein
MSNIVCSTILSIIKRGSKPRAFGKEDAVLLSMFKPAISAIVRKYQRHNIQIHDIAIS